MAETTLREIIRQKSEELRFVDQIGPHKASEELVSLSSLLASLNAYIVERKYWYNAKRQEIRRTEKSAADAKIFAEATTEWKEWQEAEAQKDALKQLIASIKYYLRTAEEEMRESRY